MKFEWNEAKNEMNICSHGIDFMDVHQVFNGPMIINSDDREYYGENRWIGTGFLGNTIVVLVFTEKYKDTIRIISARKANKHERKEFEQELAYRLGQVKSHDG